MGSTTRKSMARRHAMAHGLAIAGCSPEEIRARSGLGRDKAYGIWKFWQQDTRKPSEGEEMPYTRRQYEQDLQESLERIELDLRGLEGNDGTLEDAKRRADKRHELQARARELEGQLAESRMKHPDGGYQEALTKQAQRMHTPADRSRVELDERVKRHMKETGETNYASVAKKLVELERMG